MGGISGRGEVLYDMRIGRMHRMDESRCCIRWSVLLHLHGRF